MPQRHTLPYTPADLSALRLLQALRLRSRLSRAELARLMYEAGFQTWNRQVVSAIQAGDRRIALAELHHLATGIFHVPIEWFFDVERTALLDMDPVDFIFAGEGKP